MDWTDKIIVMGVGITEKQENKIKETIVNKVTEKGQQMDSKCVQCGNENDLMVAFTKHKVCGKCVKKNYKKVVKGK